MPIFSIRDSSEAVPLIIWMLVLVAYRLSSTKKTMKMLQPIVSHFAVPCVILVIVSSFVKGRPMLRTEASAPIIPVTTAPSTFVRFFVLIARVPRMYPTAAVRNMMIQSMAPASTGCSVLM